MEVCVHVKVLPVYMYLHVCVFVRMNVRTDT